LPIKAKSVLADSLNPEPKNRRTQAGCIHELAKTSSRVYRYDDFFDIVVRLNLSWLCSYRRVQHLCLDFGLGFGDFSIHT
jgi:hypothetical protein